MILHSAGLRDMMASLDHPDCVRQLHLPARVNVRLYMSHKHDQLSWPVPGCAAWGSAAALASMPARRCSLIRCLKRRCSLHCTGSYCLHSGGAEICTSSWPIRLLASAHHSKRKKNEDWPVGGWCGGQQEAAQTCTRTPWERGLGMRCCTATSAGPCFLPAPPDLLCCRGDEIDPTGTGY